MRFLHISDLHIGKRVNEFSMMEDQAHILRQILDIVSSERVDAVLIAGDIYDKSVPSAEAVQVFDWFLTGLADLGKKVFAVSGNHDSPERIAFGAQLMSGRGVYVSPVYDGKAVCQIMSDSYGELGIYLLPFIKPAVVRHALEGEEGTALPESYQEAVKLAIDRMKIDGARRNILIAHQFVTGAGRCDSEEVAVGGLDNVDASVFDGFDYVALGHIHSPQSMGRESIRYCGTPLKYSFSEAEQVKSVTIVELKEKGRIHISALPLKPLRDMRKIRGSYEEVMSKSFYENTSTEDYVQITLTDEEDILDGMQRLRTVYPNLMSLIYDNRRTRQDRAVETDGQAEQKSEMELFGEFFELQNNQPMSGEQAAYMEKLIEGLK